MRFSWPYRQEPYAPFWGPVTSKANFCEQDYILTTYIAEVINTLTNSTYRMFTPTFVHTQSQKFGKWKNYVGFSRAVGTMGCFPGRRGIGLETINLTSKIVCYAIYGIVSNTRRKDAFLRNLPYLGIAGVGIGSAIFHSTLKNYTQWCDDLSMLIATATVLHRVFTFDKSMKTTVISGTAITTFMALFITWHCVTDEIIMHSVLFGVMIAVVGIKTRSIISARVSDLAVRKEVKKLVTWGGVTFVSGFVLWNIDNQICSSLTHFKRRIGMPWSFFFELHGWWHILTGIGAYTFIALVEYLTSQEAGQPLGKRFAWPVGSIVNGYAGGKIDESSALLDDDALADDEVDVEAGAVDSEDVAGEGAVTSKGRGAHVLNADGRNSV